MNCWSSATLRNMENRFSRESKRNFEILDWEILKINFEIPKSKIPKYYLYLLKTFRR